VPGRISICCPTRGRPANMRRLSKWIMDRSSHPENIELLFYVDNDDVESINQAAEMVTNPPGHAVGYLVGPRLDLSKLNNILAKDASNDIIFILGDDVVVESDGWDDIVYEQFERTEDKIMVLYGEDGVQDRIATHFLIHKNWVDTLGYVVPPIFPGDWQDEWITDVAVTIKRLVFDPRLKFMHYHPTSTVRGVQNDQTYLDKYNRDNYGRVGMNAFRNNATLRNQNAMKLLSFIKRSKPCGG